MTTTTTTKDTTLSRNENEGLPRLEDLQSKVQEATTHLAKVTAGLGELGEGTSFAGTSFASWTQADVDFMFAHIQRCREELERVSRAVFTHLESYDATAESHEALARIGGKATRPRELFGKDLRGGERRETRLREENKDLQDQVRALAQEKNEG